LAFKLWDAVRARGLSSGLQWISANLYIKVYKGSQNADDHEFKEAKLWDDANKWLAERR
jgi:hypothetical protein